ncbi:disease resistance protein [Striga asiatica]|uniref:Disease resistance protein n=1 Tax=Striga asiatica TaxID=4170 RepID=A0A5A7QDC1_STRAF|nr:disease resistance protein [Striga asiatica]
MAAAYAALLSLRHTIEHLQNHPRPPISLDETQTKLLTEYITFLLDFLENYSFVDSQKADSLEVRMSDAAYEAEDLIESHIADQIQAHAENLSTDVDFLYEGLHKATEELEAIKNEIQKQNLGVRKNLSPAAADGISSLRRSPSSPGNYTMVGCDDVMIDVMDKLTYGQRSLQIIPIVGMGGIGKTTLAKNIYMNPVIVEYFHLRGWAVISQNYNLREILLEVLLCLNIIENREDSSQMSEYELGDKLHRTLFGTTYFVVMDDMWSIEAWYKVKSFFPDNNKRSRIVVTTRLSSLASQLSGFYGLEMSFLNDHNSWRLFQNSAFGEDGFCPPQLEKTGKRIVKSCKGLPLSITVIGGLLSKHTQSLDYWEYVLENFNAVLNTEDDERCLKILRLSYMELPVHLKPCFLYMGLFREDSVIPTSRLVKLWVAEGFLKPISGKSLEMVAEDYIGELVNRNLILVDEFGSTGNMKSFKIHDLLRELCVKEGLKNKFMCVRRADDPKIQQDIKNKRRIGFHPTKSGDLEIGSKIGPFQSSSLGSFIWDCGSESISLPQLKFKLLRVLMVLKFPDPYILRKSETISWPTNSRLLDFPFSNSPTTPFPANCLWNLQTLAIKGLQHYQQIEFWKMPQLRHVKCQSLYLPDPKEESDSLIVLHNLQTLKTVWNFKCSEEVIKRIPNIKKLAIKYEGLSVSFAPEDYCLNNLCQLEKLETLSCINYGVAKLGQSLVFPNSLKKLTLFGREISWKDVGTKIGRLPNLLVLKLWDCQLGPKWVTVESQFRRLKYLSISNCNDLISWEVERTHFPCLERIYLDGLEKLEIPREIGDIPTLKSIEVDCCSNCVLASAQRILREQRELGNEGLRLRRVFLGLWF